MYTPDSHYGLEEAAWAIYAIWQETRNIAGWIASGRLVCEEVFTPQWREVWFYRIDSAGERKCVYHHAQVGKGKRQREVTEFFEEITWQEFCERYRTDERYQKAVDGAVVGFNSAR